MLPNNYGFDDLNPKFCFKFSEKGGATVEKNTISSKEKLLEYSPSENQYKQSFTYSACGAYGIGHTFDETRQEDITKGQELWEKVVQNYGGGAQGSYMGDNLQMMKDEGYIKGWAVCESVDEIKQAIQGGQAVYTGTNKADWSAMKKDGVFVPTDKGTGHLFCIAGYNDYKKQLVVKDSSGPIRNNNKYFYIPYEYFDLLYTKIVLILSETEAKQLRQKRDDKDIEYAINNRLTNGQKLSELATREQAVLMLGRMMLPSITDDERLIIMKDEGLWNGERPNMPLLRYEAMLMCSAYLGFRIEDDIKTLNKFVGLGLTNGKRLFEKITRYELILLISRTLQVK